ncbi:hypothetical protein GCM10009623_34380 [Nocardioides aestuarii]|uniref:ComEC/Rec2 family competence protein n=1 Tax=Nocardioides aestuarii TaxID=252231 RepID=A0ABW4TRM4_9ACTN
MYEIDFLPIEETGSTGSKSGDAIAMRFDDNLGRQRVVVIDGGYKNTGDRLVTHIRDYYATTHVDLVISTHPDGDHIRGLTGVLEELTVGELMIHRPHDHHPKFADYSNIEVIDALIGQAEERGVTVTEPVTGLTRFGGILRILGPTADYYEELLAEDLDGERAAAVSKLSEFSLMHKAMDLLSRALDYLPTETLGEGGYTSPRNRTSVVTLLAVDGDRVMFTGDAGIESLERAMDEYDAVVGDPAVAALTLLQAPHHGSRRNLSPTILDRILGKPGEPFGTGFGTAIVSSAAADPKHPSPKVTNALQRRGMSVFATEGRILCYPGRPGWTSATELPPLVEDDD